MKKNKYYFLCFIICSLISKYPAQKKIEKQYQKPLIIGVIDEIQSSILSEKRMLNIYFPEGYDNNDTIKYPVIYVLDGSINEDFFHLAGIVQYNTFSWVNQIPKSIVVGIANINRKRDFTDSTNIFENKKLVPSCGGSSKFISFIEEELQPYIEKNYKTNSIKTIIGQSLAGLLATEILFTKPGLFSTYIIVSPSLWWNDGALLKKTPSILNKNFTQKINIYVGVGKEGLSPGIGNHTMELDAKLLVKKIKESKSSTVKIYFDYLPKENHATVTHQAVFNAFRILYPFKNK
ncbi:MAG: alpha/beta hydrolase [Bacteroidetes bacterium]|nr:alpha/beta hydrolase [Bacteroidota bacterium]